jgi:hypothetical protein
MSFRRYEILWPNRYNDGTPVEAEKFLTTYEELLVRFGGLSVQAESVEGYWLHEGERYEDSNRRIFVDIEETPDTESFFANFKQVLKERFRQLDIWIVSHEIRIT